MQSQLHHVVGTRILRYQHVGVPFLPSLFVAHGAVHEFFLLLFHPSVGIVEIAPVASLVAQRQDGDAGIVLCAAVHILNAVHVSLFPVGVIGQRATRFAFVAHAVALNVGFVIDVKAILIGKFINAVSLRIMAQPDGIDVVLLHQRKVAADEFFGDIVAGEWVVLVEVHALELHRLTIHEQHRVCPVG